MTDAKMNAMLKPLRAFGITLLTLWILLGIAALWYSQLHNIPAHVAWTVLPAFAIESVFYLATGTEELRVGLDRLRPLYVIASALTISAVIPYVVYTVPARLFSWQNLLLLTFLAALSSFWFLLFGRSTFTDLTFLLFVAAVYVGKVFGHVYPDPASKVPMSVLGTLMWTRIGVCSVLNLRRMPGIGFSLLPRAKDWALGLRFYLLFLPPGLAVALAVHFLRPAGVSLTWKLAAIAVATFAGTLFVLAAMEEFFFRGMLQQILSVQLKSQVTGLIATSLLFGTAHLWKSPFPNWRFALMAALAGLFYGLGYQQARSVRTAMVTHALVVTTWRVFLS